MATSTYRQLSPSDSARIKCSGNRWSGNCQQQATVCEQLEWNTGNATGVSFFYNCDDCVKRTYRATNRHWKRKGLR